MKYIACLHLRKRPHDNATVSKKILDFGNFAFLGHIHLVAMAPIKASPLHYLPDIDNGLSGASSSVVTEAWLQLMVFAPQIS